jgi:cbb3-type cytochrome oxidase subunit 3
MEVSTMRKINGKVAAKWTAWVISMLFIGYVAFALYSVLKGGN